MSNVERAIILAAGKGTRLKPITLTTPKPLIEVNGKRMIETIIDALVENNIKEIYIVLGYMKEKFYYLKNKYSNIKFIENSYYDECNNISSLYVARDFLENCIIMDADQIVYNKKMLFREFEYSGYCCSWEKNYTKEWVLSTDNDGIVINCSTNGGKDGWKLYSVSRWNANDGIKLKKLLVEEFINKRNRYIYWDDIALNIYPEEFELKVYEINEKDLLEIDSIDELSQVDLRYIKYKGDDNNEEK